MQKTFVFPIVLLAALFSSSLLAGTAKTVYAAEEISGMDKNEWIFDLPEAKDKDTKQLFAVSCDGMDKTTATLYFLERDEKGNWKEILTSDAYVGSNGLCRDEDHQEGISKTPTGTYTFTEAFGIADDPGCAMPYTKLNEYMWWSGDSREGMQYNQMIDIRDYPNLDLACSEHLIDCWPEYKYCLNISFNEDGTPYKGSAIFLHCLTPGVPYTAGCVAIPEEKMEQVIKEVQEGCVVIIDTEENLMKKQKENNKQRRKTRFFV